MDTDGLDQTTSNNDWQKPLVFLCVGLLSVFILYYPVWESMVKIWIRSETYAHGFIIFPISIWLIWKNKHILQFSIPKYSPLGAVSILVIGFVWLLASITDIQVVQQLCAIALLLSVIVGVLGLSVFYKIAFPLLFLFAAVPMGEALIPHLIDFTANFTVYAVKLTGIPIYREGNNFELPSGSWSVVEACSGSRYLIASVTLGLLYSYLSYTSYVKRSMFIIVSIIVPIIANGLRAFLIVMIGHFSGMTLAVGVDHLVYGWLFFGIVIGLMFFIGSFWRDAEEEKSSETELNQKNDNSNIKKQYVHFGILMVALLSWPIVNWQFNNVEMQTNNIHLQIAESKNWKLAKNQLTEWRPVYVGADATEFVTLEENQNRVAVYLAYYAYQRQGAELINSQNVLVTEKDEIWKQIYNGASPLTLNNENITVKFNIIQSGSTKLQVYTLNWIGGKLTANDYLAKLFEAKNRLIGGERSSAAIVFVTNVKTKEESTEIIQSFMSEIGPGILKTLESQK